jgi:hypothetical protein
LKFGIVVVADHFLHQPRKRGGFDECQHRDRV